MLIYDLLKKDHETLKGLLSELVNLNKEQHERRSALIDKIRDELVPHARAEEAVFYNSLREIDMAKDLAWHGYEEHVEAETLLRTLQVMDMANLEWKKTAQKLKSAIEHHISEEEGKIFSAARQLFIDEEAEAMGEAFERMKSDVAEGSFVQNSVEMIANMMPARLSRAVRSFTYRA
jgi:hypothetical protein